MKLMQNVSVAVARNNARTVALRQTTRIPVRTSSMNDVVACGGAITSRLPIFASSSADATKVSASAAIAMGAVSQATSAPPSAGPEISATASTASRFPLASRRRLPATRSVMNTWSARWYSTVAMPVTTATAYSKGSVTRPAIAAKGIDSSATARTRSAPIISGRRRWRSTMPPPNHARIAPGSVSATVSRPRSNAPAPAVTIAAIGNAVRVIREPTAETPCALHSSRKSR